MRNEGSAVAFATCSMARRRRIIHAMKTLLCCLVLGLCCAPVLAQKKSTPRSVQGLISKVVEGDIVVLTLPDQSTVQVRLRDIDAPDSCQPYGDDARKALSELALNKVATLQPSGKDRGGGTVGTLLIDELNVSRFLVENGHAWSIRTRWDQGPLVKQERQARALSRGLHGQPGAMQPKEYRRQHGACPAPTAGEPAAAPAVAAPKR
jgi:micrococcal nuclease